MFENHTSIACSRILSPHPIIVPPWSFANQRKMNLRACSRISRKLKNYIANGRIDRREELEFSTVFDFEVGRFDSASLPKMPDTMSLLVFTGGERATWSPPGASGWSLRAPIVERTDFLKGGTRRKRDVPKIRVSTRLYAAANPHENLGSENGFSVRVHLGFASPNIKKSIINIIKKWYIF